MTPDEINAAAQTFAAQQMDVLIPAINTLADALAANAGMAGNDAGAHTFAAVYDPAATAAVNALGVAVASIGSIATALNTTANNYILADAHSAAGGPPPATYPPPAVVVAETNPPPPSSLGPGTTGMPGFIAKYWPNGHQDSLRAAASAWSAMADALADMAYTLQNSVMSITLTNSSASIDAMNTLWAQIWGPSGGQGSLGVIHTGCTALANACNTYAGTIDSAHSEMEHKLTEAGIAIGLTTFLGILGSIVTLGGSDAAASAADAAEAEALLSPLAEEFLGSVAADMAETIGPDLLPDLDAAADATPILNSVDAETTQVENLLEEEMADAQVPARVGGGDGPADPPPGGGGGGEPPDDGEGRGEEGLPDKPGKLTITGTKATPEEINAAQQVADQGHDVVLRDPPLDGGTRGMDTSDLLVDGEKWDVYSPRTGNLTRIVGAIAEKGDQVDGGGVVLNLENSPLNPGDINLPQLLARVRGITSKISSIIIVK